MDIKIEQISKLLENVLGLNTRVIKEGDLPDFIRENRFPFYTSQLFSEEKLSSFLSSMKPGVYCELKDELNVFLFCFVYRNSTFLLGPYIKQDYNDIKIDLIISSNHLDASYFSQLRLYYSSFPILHSHYIEKTINDCLNALDSDYGPHHFENGLLEKEADEKVKLETTQDDYGKIALSYEIENNFLHVISTGQVELIGEAFKELSTRSSNPFSGHYGQEDFSSSFATIRALARKAAENSGLSIFIIHEITQRYSAMKSQVKGELEKGNLIYQMIYELTLAVKEYLESKKKYSKFVLKIIDYLKLNYSKEISIASLANVFQKSPSYLSRTFKKEVGMGAVSYLNQIRLAKAAGLLKSNELFIGDIAKYVGFADLNYFGKLFKAKHGLTPREYAKL